MMIDTKKLRELAEAATVENCQRAGENPGAMLQRFYEAFTRDTALALLDEIERLQAQEKSDNQELLMAACEIEDLRDRLATMTEARNEIYTIAKRTFDLKLMTPEEATRLEKLRSVGTDKVGK